MMLKLFAILLALYSNGSKGLPLENSEDNLEIYFEPYILGGTQAPENYAPHMAGLVVGYDLLMMACGASIISTDRLLTAAHCIDMFIERDGKLLKTFIGVVGSNNWNSGGLYVRFEDFHIHPKWDHRTLKYDIGVLHLEKKLTLNEKVVAIPLGFDHVEGDVDCYVTGWGFSRPGFIPFLLQLLNAKTVDSETCIHDMKKISAQVGWNPPEIDPNLEICTIHSVNHGNCYGDSGSPLISRETNQQIGVVSWVLPCASGAPDIYVRISGVEDYILKALQKRN